MSRWFVEDSIEVIGHESAHTYLVDAEWVLGIRVVNDRFEVVFNDGRVVSIPASQAIVEYKQVSKEEFLANMKALY